MYRNLLLNWQSWPEVCFRSSILDATFESVILCCPFATVTAVGRRWDNAQVINDLLNIMTVFFGAPLCFCIPGTTGTRHVRGRLENDVFQFQINQKQHNVEYSGRSLRITRLNWNYSLNFGTNVQHAKLYMYCIALELFWTYSISPQPIRSSNISWGRKQQSCWAGASQKATMPAAAAAPHGKLRSSSMRPSVSI